LASAKKKGVIPANAQMSDEQAINLIFHPGFSTKTEVSEVSGRGVGMDVVKTNIEKLSGRVQVFSEVGKGSRFRIELPLTMAVIDGMIVSVEGSRYVFPLGQVYETLQITPDHFHSITGLGEILVVRGDKVPVRRIKDVLGIRANDKPAEDMTAIIVTSNKGKVAVLVDDILNNQQVVIKSIDNNMNKNRLFVGSSIMGDGLPSLIVDLNRVLEMTYLNREAIGA
jgi:two-component system chemotaxis sensor kinase CheA